MVCGQGSGQQSSESEDVYLRRSAAAWAHDLTNADTKSRRAAAFALGKLSKHVGPVLPALAQALQNDTDSTVRESVASTLGEVAVHMPAVVVKVLISALPREKDVAVQRAMALSLGKAGEAAAAAEPQLRPWLNSKDSLLRQNTAWALGQLGKAAEPAIPKLIHALKDSEAGVRGEAVQALGNLGLQPEDTIPAMMLLLEDREAQVQEYTVLALRRWGPQAVAATPGLLTIAENPIASVALRQAALLTLEAVWPTGVKDNTAWERLQRLSTSANEAAIKKAASQAEKKIGPLRK